MSTSGFSRSLCQFYVRYVLGFLLACSVAFPSLGQSGDRSSSNRDRPAIGIVTGMVIDASLVQPVPFASVALISKRDSTIVAGVLTDEQGKFRLSEIPLGHYRLKIQFMGYESYILPQIAISPRGKTLHELDTISLQPLVNTLSEAVIATEVSTLELLVDRQVFHVGTDLTQSGSTASELLMNVPSVQVDIDGNITLRGSSNIQVLIDGRPSGLSGAAQDAYLQQIPSSAIERVEVITNPSARYDPDGMAGILNIVLKKNKLSGFHGQVQATPGTGDNHNASASLNYKGERWSIFSSASWNDRDNFMESTAKRFFDGADSSNVLDQYSYGSRLSTSVSARLGMEFTPSDHTTWSVSGNLFSNEGGRGSSASNNEVWDSGWAANTQRETSSIQDGWGADLDASYHRTYSSRNHQLIVRVRTSGSHNNSLDTIHEFTPDYAVEMIDYNGKENDNARTVASLDFEKPMPHEGKLELGWKTNINRPLNQFEYLNPDSLVYDQGIYVPFGNISADYTFSYDEDIHAAYATYGRKVGVFTVQSGLRVEQVFTHATLDDDAPFENNYFSAYPSSSIALETSETQTWSASYSRRVNRPRGRQTNPFVNDSDPRNIRTGNPLLLPEYTNSLQLSHQWSRDRASITSSLFYRDTKDVIRHYSSIDVQGITTLTYINMKGRHDEGFETILMWPLGKTGSIRVSGSVYHLVNEAPELISVTDTEGWSWDMRSFASWTLGKHWKCQANAYYRGPSVTAQGQFNGFFYSDLAIQRDIFNSKLQVSARVTDIFNSRSFSYSSAGVNFNREAEHKRESRNAYLTLTWRFGKLAERSSERSGRSGGSGREGGGDDGFDY